MFSAFKKLTSRSNSAGGGDGNGLSLAPPPGLTTMSSSLQKKFAKGVHYNMKIILKGDRNVGKTQLFRRLQGLAFVEEYTATEEIQVANITWNYKTSDDIVKVEIWDVVDIANRKKKLPSDKLKLENSSALQENGDLGHEIALDANTIDVYKNTNGVILMFDITKSWTFDYVKREIDNVPDHIPILIMGNRRDMGHHRAVASDTVSYFIEGLERDSTVEIRYTESSMRNGFGLKYIHKFFNLPYLHLQKEALLKTLEVNRKETEITIQELEYYADGDEANYDLFIDNLSQKRRQVADALAPPKLSLPEAQAVASAKALREAKDPAEVAARLAVKSDPTTNRQTDHGGKSSSPRVGTGGNNGGLETSGGGSTPIPEVSPSGRGGNSNGANTELTTGRNETNRNANLNSGQSNNSSNKGGQNKRSSANTNNLNSFTGPGGVEDFVPEDDIQKISSFLDDGFAGGSQQPRNNALHLEDSSDEEGGGNINPMVAALEEDIDDLDLKPVRPIGNVSILSNSSSENEEDRAEPFDNPTFPSSKLVSSSSKIGFGVFLQDDNEKGESSGDSKEKKSHKKSHKKSSSKHKKKKEPKHRIPDLDEFLSGEPSQLKSVDTSAYEAI